MEKSLKAFSVFLIILTVGIIFFAFNEKVEADEVPANCQSFTGKAWDYECTGTPPQACSSNPITIQGYTGIGSCVTKCHALGGKVARFSTTAQWQWDWYCCNANDSGTCTLQTTNDTSITKVSTPTPISDLLNPSPSYTPTNNAPARLELDWPPSPLGTSLMENSDITILIKYFYEWGIALGGFAAFISLIIAGIQYLTSAGNAGKMKDAMDRIKATVIGLVLLLSSVLILNTINPQLTVLKIPDFSAVSTVWDVTIPPPTSNTSICEYVELFAGPNFTTLLHAVKPDYQLGTLNSEVLSVRFEGSCQLTLYRLTNFKTNSDNPPLPIYGSVRDMRAFGETYFGSVHVTNVNNF